MEETVGAAERLQVWVIELAELCALDSELDKSSLGFGLPCQASHNTERSPLVFGWLVSSPAI